MMLIVLLCSPSFRSPSTITGVSLPFMIVVSITRSPVASAVRRIVDKAAPSAVVCGR